MLIGWEYVAFGFFLVCMSVIGGWMAIKHFHNQKWNFKWVLAKDTNGPNSEIIKSGLCRLVKITSEGGELFYIKELKVYRMGYGKRIGRNQVLWFEGDDGYWYNTVFGRFDKAMRALNLKPTDKNMRMAHSAMETLLQNELKKKTFMEQYGVIITFGLLLLCIIAMGASQYYTAKQIKDTLAQSIEAKKLDVELTEKQERIINKLDEMKIGGTGLVYSK